MKLYRLSKIFTKSLLTVFLALFSFSAIYLTIYNRTEAADGDTDNSTCVSNGLQFVISGDQSGKIQINKPFNVTISKTSAGSNKSFDIEIHMYDRRTDTDNIKYSGNMSAAGDSFQISQSLNTIGDKEIYVVYTQLDGNGGHCYPSEETGHINIEGIDNLSSSSNITIGFRNATGSTANTGKKGDQINIDYTISNGNGKWYDLSINKGGSDCPASSTDSACWSNKVSEGIYSDNVLSKTYPWNTTDAELGGHQIKIKVYDLNTSNNAMSDIKTATFTLCKPDAKEGECVGTGDSGGSGSGSGGTGGTPVQDVSFSGLNISLKSLFGTSDPTSLSLTDIFNPSSGVSKDNPSILGRVFKWALDFAGIVAVIMILYASIIYATSYGEESKAELAKKTLTWSVVGLVAIALSETILTIILKALS